MKTSGLSRANLPHQFSLEDHMNDMDSNAHGEPVGNINSFKLMNNGDNDDDFKLSKEDEEALLGHAFEAKRPSDEEHLDYETIATGRKPKRTRYASPENPTHTQVRASSPFILDEDTTIPTKQSSHTLGFFGRRPRQKNDRLPAYFKPVSHELDSDDELILQMREKGFSDRQIAEKLAKEGRVKYDAKSISTRIMRIRLAQAENVEFLIKEGYKEWEFEDDCLLIQAHALADIEINYEIERIRAWRFRKVSEYMRRLNKTALFSENACRERYNALIEGTARIPSSIDDDPEARRAELDAFRTAREQIRAKEATERLAKEDAERKAKEQIKARNAQRAEETAKKRAEKEIAKTERAKMRVKKAELRLKQSLENQAAKEKRNEQVKQQKIGTETKKTRNWSARTTKSASSAEKKVTRRTGGS